MRVFKITARYFHLGRLDVPDQDYLFDVDVARLSSIDYNGLLGHFKECIVINGRISPLPTHYKSGGKSIREEIHYIDVNRLDKSGVNHICSLFKNELFLAIREDNINQLIDECI